MIYRTIRRGLRRVGEEGLEQAAGGADVEDDDFAGELFRCRHIEAELGGDEGGGEGGPNGEREGDAEVGVEAGGDVEGEGGLVGAVDRFDGGEQGAFDGALEAGAEEGVDDDAGGGEERVKALGGD